LEAGFGGVFSGTVSSGITEKVLSGGWYIRRSSTNGALRSTIIFD
jgi:hypothetical protein